MTAVIQYILYLVILVALAVPLGAYIKKVMNGEKTFLSRVLTPCENLVYKVMRVNRDERCSSPRDQSPMDWCSCSCSKSCRESFPAIPRAFPV